MIDREFEQMSEEHMMSMSKPTQECPVCLETPCSHFHNAVPATPAPSQPAGAREVARNIAAGILDRLQTRHGDVVLWIQGQVQAYAAQQTAAKDAELKQRDDDDRVVQEHTNSIIEKYEADLLAAERERDSLREQCDAIADDYQDLGKELAKLSAENAALKAREGWAAMSTRTNCICNSPDTGYTGPCPAHPERMITSKATLCPDCGDEHGDKPAATGSEEPATPNYIDSGLNGPDYVPTPPASQSTVTLDRVVEAVNLIKQRVCGNASPHWSNDNKVTSSRMLIADWCDTALALLRAAERVPKQD